MDAEIEAMRAERGKHVLNWSDARYGDRRINAVCLCGEWRMGVDSRDLGDLHVDFARHIEAHVLDALLSPRIEKGPIAYLAENVRELETENDELWADLIIMLKVRGLALEAAATTVQPGPDGQDYIDRGRMIEGWLDEAYESFDGGGEPHRKYRAEAERLIASLGATSETPWRDEAMARLRPDESPKGGA